jgi:hypothetical protein
VANGLKGSASRVHRQRAIARPFRKKDSGIARAISDNMTGCAEPAKVLLGVVNLRVVVMGFSNNQMLAAIAG